MMSMNSPSLEQPDVQGLQAPRIEWIPEHVSSAGQEATELAAIAGLNLDPWEQRVLAGALGERADGKWAAFEVGLVVPRQNGKGAILEARELAGPILFGEKLLIHSAHEQATSSEHFLRLLALFEEAELSVRMKRPIKGKGSEAILFRNGARILFKTRTGGGGRGLTGDFVGLDEAMMLPEAATAALVPTMAARSVTGNPQLWYSGSAVDCQTNDDGVVLARVRERGINQAPRLAYFEWSAEGENPSELTGEVRGDPEVWAQANPGLGIRISLEHVANEHSGALGTRAFAVERLGVGDWPPTDENAGQVISDDAWRACRGESDEAPLAFAVDIRRDRSFSSIASADRRRHVRLEERRPGTGWVVERLEELTGQHPVPVLVDEKGPARSLIADLGDAGVDVVSVTGTEYAESCQVFFDAVVQGAMSHEGTPELDAAVKGVAQRTLGDAWAWSRRSSLVDISPLVAATLALRGVDRELESVYEDRGLLVISLD